MKSALAGIYLAFMCSLSEASQEQDKPSLEQEVSELLVGAPGLSYIHGRPDYNGIVMKIGEKAIPVLLKLASTSDRAREHTYIVLHHFSFMRMTLPDSAQAWVVKEFENGGTNQLLLTLIGHIGTDADVQRLEEIANGNDERVACAATRAVAGIGTDKARLALERLQRTGASAEARRQAKWLLEKAIYPYQGDQAEALMLRDIESCKIESLKHAPSGWFYLYKNLVRRWLRTRKRAVVPQLDQIKERILAKNEDYLNRSPRVWTILAAIKLLGGKLSGKEIEALQKNGVIEVHTK